MPALLPALAAVTVVPKPADTTPSLAAQALDLLFPVRCAGCGKIGVLWCASCQAAVHAVPQPVCVRCGLPQPRAGRCALCAVGEFHVSAIRAAALYAEPLSTAIHRFKYEDRPELHAPLGGLMITYWQGRTVTADLVVAVPLHENRLQTRGFNQSQLLAETLCAGTGLPLLRPGVLVRHRETQQQMLLGPAERHSNVDGAFGWQGPDLSGCKVLLVDDVATTGSTLEACAAALLAAGASKIWALTVARAVGHHDSA